MSNQTFKVGDKVRKLHTTKVGVVKYVPVTIKNTVEVLWEGEHYRMTEQTSFLVLYEVEKPFTASDYIADIKGSLEVKILALENEAKIHEQAMTKIDKQIEDLRLARRKHQDEIPMLHLQAEELRRHVKNADKALELLSKPEVRKIQVGDKVKIKDTEKATILNIYENKQRFNGLVGKVLMIGQLGKTLKLEVFFDELNPQEFPELVSRWNYDRQYVSATVLINIDDVEVL